MQTPAREFREFEGGPAARPTMQTPRGARTAPSTPSRCAPNRAPASAVAPRPQVPPTNPPQGHWVTPGGPNTTRPKFYVVLRGRCCGVFWNWYASEFVVFHLDSHLVFVGILLKPSSIRLSTVATGEQTYMLWHLQHMLKLRTKAVSVSLVACPETIACMVLNISASCSLIT
jgi:hypothetical protein